MADVNHVILIGRLTRDAEIKYLTSGAAVLKFSIAVNAKKKQGDQWVDEASFFDCVLYGKQGEAINQYMTKGKQIAVEGRLHQNRWEQEGQSRSKVEINADNVQLLGGGNQQAAPANQGSQQAAPTDSQPGDFPDDIPF